jgi:SAM-dependent methyltransferase
MGYAEANGNLKGLRMSGEITAREMWNQRYDGEEYIYGVTPNDFLKENAHLIPKGHLLCVADGEGRNSVYLAEEGWEVTAVDISEVGIAKNRALAALRNVTVNTHIADIMDFDLGTDRWSGVVSIFAHMPPALRLNLHQRLIAALSPGGVLILEAYTPDQIGRGTGGPNNPEMLMTVADLQRELSPLEIIHSQEIVREVVEGPGHSGMGAVVQVIARKN